MISPRFWLIFQKNPRLHVFEKTTMRWCGDLKTTEVGFMSRCPEIHHLKFDLASERAVEGIRRKIDAANLGASAMAGGVVLQMFARNDTLQSAYSISQTDWHLFSSAMISWHWILRREIESIANLQELDHANDPAQRSFWRAVANGCQL